MKITEIVTESALDDKKLMAWVAWSNEVLVRLSQVVRSLYNPKNADTLQQYLAELGEGEDNRPNPHQIDKLVAYTKHWIKQGAWKPQENEWFANLDEVVGHYAPLYEFAREATTLKDEIIPFWNEWKKDHGISPHSIRQHTMRPKGTTLQ